MDAILSGTLLTLTKTLAELVVKNTASAITTKIKSFENEKDISKLKNGYEEIITQLIAEKEEALRIAQSYKSEISKFTISDEDIRYLHSTVGNIIEIMSSYGFSSENDTKNMEILQKMISVDTLKSMQLIGFNYREAIGEPLTALCAQKISSWGDSENKNKNKNKNSR